MAIKTSKAEILKDYARALPLDKETVLLQKTNNEAGIFNITTQTILKSSSDIPAQISTALLFSPQQLIVGAENCSIRIWNLGATSPDKAMTLLNNGECRGPVLSLTKLDDTHFISTDARKFLKIWSIESKEPTHEHKFDHRIMAVHVDHADQLTLLESNSFTHYNASQYTISAQSLTEIKKFKFNGKSTHLSIQHAFIDSPTTIKIFRTADTPKDINSIWVEKSPKGASDTISNLYSIEAPDMGLCVAAVSTGGHFACFFSQKNATLNLLEDPKEIQLCP